MPSTYRWLHSQWLQFVFVIALVAACNSPAAPVTSPAASASQPPAVSTSDALPQVIAPNGTHDFSLSVLQKLPAATITVDGEPQDGPALIDGLKTAGVTDFKEVTVSGAGSITLTKEQVTSEVILDFTNRGTVKFAATNVPQANWPKDITRIEVE